MYRPSLSCLVEQYMQFDVPDLACLARKASVGSVPCRVYARKYNTCTVSDGVIRIIWRIGQVKKSTVLYLFPPLLYSSKAFSVQKRYQTERIFFKASSEVIRIYSNLWKLKVTILSKMIFTKPLISIFSLTSSVPRYGRGADSSPPPC